MLVSLWRSGLQYEIDFSKAHFKVLKGFGIVINAIDLILTELNSVKLNNTDFRCAESINCPKNPKIAFRKSYSQNNVSIHILIPKYT